MRITVATDAWHPQVNGVVRSIQAVVAEAPAQGATIDILSSEGLATVGLPTYPDIRLALPTPGALSRRLHALAPDHIHIATEGPVGLAARRHCVRSGLPFTTSYHTRFPEYLAARAPVPCALTYAALRWFHNGGAATMVATDSLAAELAARGFRNLRRWGRGVDGRLFRPRPGPGVLDLPRPIFLSVGRLAVEKNLPAFLSLDLPGSKVVAGEGPARRELEARFPDAAFVGLRTGEDLAALYASADVFVFPSRTDTFGVVLLEALASGLPVAAYPVQGPRDILGGTQGGVLDADLGRACLGALAIPRAQARALALRYSWAESARQFLGNIAAARDQAGAALAA